jgi:hypothetical protein
MKRIAPILMIMLAAIVAGTVVVSAKPDFSGSWMMDRARSFGMPGNMQQTMVVTHKGDQLELETKLIQPDNERVVKDSYILDGKEHEFQPPTPPNAPKDAPPPAKGKRTGNWLPAGNGFTVTETITNQTPQGAVTTQLTRKWTLSADGELTIDMYIDNPNGSFETKRIFKRS